MRSTWGSNRRLLSLNKVVGSFFMFYIQMNLIIILQLNVLTSIFIMAWSIHGSVFPQTGSVTITNYLNLTFFVSRMFCCPKNITSLVDFFHLRFRL